jgi:DNA repair exonuclease SbcCD ATPase subunit
MAEENALETPTEPTAEQVAAEEQARIEAEAAEKREQEETESKPWFKKRFDEITRKKYEADARADEERKKREEIERRAQELEDRIQKLEKKPAPQTQGGKPRLSAFIDQYDTYEEAVEAHAEAIADFKWQQNNIKAQQEREARIAQERRDNELKTFEEKRLATQSSGRVAYQDWDEVVSSIPRQIMDKSLAEALVELPGGADVCYYLGKNIQEAERISKLSPYAKAAELGKIEMKLSQTQKKPSNAPPPVSTLAGNAPASNDIDPEKDPEAWIEARNRGAI